MKGDDNKGRKRKMEEERGRGSRRESQRVTSFKGVKQPTDGVNSQTTIFASWMPNSTKIGLWRRHTLFSGYVATRRVYVNTAPLLYNYVATNNNTDSSKNINYALEVKVSIDGKVY
jgi:hypothetical protein